MKIKIKPNIIKEIKEFAKNECEKPTSKYGSGPFRYHFIPMVKYAKQLAKELGKDVEVVELAGWLHDIGSIIYGRENHHITSAKIAENKLKELNYPSKKIKLIKKCILSHRGSKNYKRISIEEKIISDADTMNCFDNIAGLFAAALVHEKLNQGEARKSVRRKLQNKWKQLCFKKSKEIIRPKYEAAMLLLNKK